MDNEKPRSPGNRTEAFDHVSDRSSSLLPILREGGAGGKTQGHSRPLPYLDGLRGIAAMMVYSQHHITQFYGDECDITRTYGWQNTNHPAALPFVRLFFNGGAPAVMIFFVLSGYVLSRSALCMLRDGQSPSRHLLSATFKRPVRLFLPPLLLSWPVALILHTPFKPLNHPVPVQSNIISELCHFLIEMIRTYNPFIGHGPYLQNFAYNPPTWTMAYELNGSYLVFASIPLFATRLPPKQRIVAWFVSAIVLFYIFHWSVPCFLIGIIIAQIDVEGMDQQFLKRLTPRAKAVFLNATFVLAWYMLTMVRSRLILKTQTGEPIEFPPRPGEELVIPDEEKEAVKAFYKAQLPPDYLAKVLPFPFDFHHWLLANMIGAMILVYVILRLSWLQHVLGSVKFFRYLGKISFALYLIHEPLKWILAIPLARMLGNAPGSGDDPFAFDGALYVPDLGMQGLSTRYLVMQAVMLPVTLVLAGILTKTVDNSSVEASKRFANIVMHRLGL